MDSFSVSTAYDAYRDIKYYADKAHAAGGYLCVDSTFAPPPLQYPFKWGADMIMHSGRCNESVTVRGAHIGTGTKYFGGHSDLLCGILVTPTLDTWKEVLNDRLKHYTYPDD